MTAACLFWWVDDAHKSQHALEALIAVAVPTCLAARPSPRTTTTTPTNNFMVVLSFMVTYLIGLRISIFIIAANYARCASRWGYEKFR